MAEFFVPLDDYQEASHWKAECQELEDVVVPTLKARIKRLEEKLETLLGLYHLGDLTPDDFVL